ncbi:hypothetical protein [Clavibacter tessellarius]|uniref:hypothetical protein n=1 Tax=Clavibacter tessellarius TaxID=31965 RepID=UPI003255233E
MRAAVALAFGETRAASRGGRHARAQRRVAGRARPLRLHALRPRAALPPHRGEWQDHVLFQRLADDPQV